MANLATCITPRISSSHIGKVLAPLGGLRAGEVVACERLVDMHSNMEVYVADKITATNINSSKIAIVANGDFEQLANGRRPKGQPDYTLYEYQEGEVATVIFLDNHLLFAIGADSIQYGGGEVPQVGEYLIPLQNSYKLGLASEFATNTALKILAPYQFPIGRNGGEEFRSGYICVVVNTLVNKAPTIAVGDKLSVIYTNNSVTPDLSIFDVSQGRVVLIDGEDYDGTPLNILYVESIGDTVGLFFDGFAGTDGTLLYVPQKVTVGDKTYPAGWQSTQNEFTFGSTIVTMVNETEGWNGVYIAKVPFETDVRPLIQVGDVIENLYFDTNIIPDLSGFDDWILQFAEGGGWTFTAGYNAEMDITLIGEMEGGHIAYINSNTKTAQQINEELGIPISELGWQTNVMPLDWAGGDSLTVAAINNQQLWQTFISKVPF